MLDKMLYNTILCQTFSPCGKYLIAGNIYGQIALFDLDRILNPLAEFLTTDYDKPKYIHHLDPNGQICSLISTEQFLIVGTINKITGWSWKDITVGKITKPSWVIDIPFQSFMERFEVNSLWIGTEDRKLYSTCGENIYVHDLEDGKLITTYRGHTDYIHCINGKGDQLVSAGEDGLVLLWDIRSRDYHNKLEPSSDNRLSRPDLGKWIGSVALSDDWIVCGGGPRPALWHVRTLDPVTVFDIPDRGIHVSYFNDDCVVVGGTCKYLYQLDYAGEIKVELPVSAATIYSAVLRTEPSRMLSIAGSSPEIDLCSSFNFRDQVIHFRHKLLNNDH